MALTPRLRAIAEDGCYELIQIDQDGGVLKLDLDGTEVELPNGFWPPGAERPLLTDCAPRSRSS
jgi:hypothetical protein